MAVWYCDVDMTEDKDLTEGDMHLARTPVFTPPEVANTGPGVNRGSGGGARGCGFEERVGVHARTGWVRFT